MIYTFYVGDTIAYLSKYFRLAVLSLSKTRLLLQTTKKAQVHACCSSESIRECSYDLPSVNALSFIVSPILTAPFIARFKSSVEFAIVPGDPRLL